MTYITTNHLKYYLGIDDSDSDDPLLDDLIDAAQSAINATCNRVFEASSNTVKYFDALRDVDGYTLYLNTDLCAINTVTNGDGTIISPSAYVLEPRNLTPYYAIRLKSSSGLSWSYTNDPEDAIAISGKWAYSVTAPDVIQQACTRLAAWFYRQKDTSKDSTGDRPIMSASGSVVMPSQLPADVRSLLSPFERRAF